MSKLVVSVRGCHAVSLTSHGGPEVSPQCPPGGSHRPHRCHSIPWCHPTSHRVSRSISCHLLGSRSVPKCPTTSCAVCGHPIVPTRVPQRPLVSHRVPQCPRGSNSVPRAVHRDRFQASPAPVSAGTPAPASPSQTRGGHDATGRDGGTAAPGVGSAPGRCPRRGRCVAAGPEKAGGSPGGREREAPEPPRRDRRDCSAAGSTTQPGGDRSCAVPRGRGPGKPRRDTAEPGSRHLPLRGRPGCFPGAAGGHTGDSGGDTGGHSEQTPKGHRGDTGCPRARSRQELPRVFLSVPSRPGAVRDRARRGAARGPRPGIGSAFEGGGDFAVTGGGCHLPRGFPTCRRPIRARWRRRWRHRPTGHGPAPPPPALPLPPAAAAAARGPGPGPGTPHRLGLLQEPLPGTIAAGGDGQRAAPGAGECGGFGRGDRREERDPTGRDAGAGVGGTGTPLTTPLPGGDATE